MTAATDGERDTIAEWAERTAAAAPDPGEQTLATLAPLLDTTGLMTPRERKVTPASSAADTTGVISGAESSHDLHPICTLNTNAGKDAEEFPPPPASAVKPAVPKPDSDVKNAGRGRAAQ